MSLFISNLAFSDPSKLTSAKIGILVALFFSASWAGLYSAAAEQQAQSRML